VADIEGTVDTLEESVAALDDAVVDTHSEIDELGDQLDSVEAELGSDIDSLRETLGEVERLADAAADEDDLADIEARIDEVEAGIETLEQFREGLSSAFGGVGDDS